MFYLIDRLIHLFADKFQKYSFIWLLFINGFTIKESNENSLRSTYQQIIQTNCSTN